MPEIYAAITTCKTLWQYFDAKPDLKRAWKHLGKVYYGKYLLSNVIILQHLWALWLIDCSTPAPSTSSHQGNGLVAKKTRLWSYVSGREELTIQISGL